MPIDFVILGIVFIGCCFYLNFKKLNNILIIVAIIMLGFGYFYGEIYLSNLKINLLNIVSILIFLIATPYLKQDNFLLNGMPLVVLLIYSIFSCIDVNFNLFFDNKLLIFITCLINLINNKNYIFNTILSLIVCEIFNLVFMLPKLGFMPIFCNDFVFCIVVCLLINIVGDFLIKTIRRKRYEKVY